jgi:hypothetical protein
MIRPKRMVVKEHKRGKERKSTGGLNLWAMKNGAARR